MSLPEARRLVKDFVAGEYNPEQHASFLKWLEKASNAELNELADEYERLQDRWSLPDVGPSAEWIMQLERKLDLLEARKREAIVAKMERRRARRLWLSTAASVLVATGAILWYSQRGPEPVSTEHNEIGPFNTVTNPRGAQLKQFALEDGSKIWLNAASTVRYPSSFIGKERMVELSGEAYFEVTRNEKQPFRVKARDAVVEVMGTNFDVQAYEDEPVAKATLMSGKIKVSRAGEERILQPGEQAVIHYSGSNLGIEKNGDKKEIQAAAAWKNGELIFPNDPIHSVMNAISRRYNVNVSYQGNVDMTKTFSGVFSKDEELSDVVQQLNQASIKCRLDDDQRITVMPGQ